MADKIQQTIDRYLDHDLAAAPDEIDDVLSEFRSQHASERMARQRGTNRRRRGTALTTLSTDSQILAVQSTLSETERLVVADDGHSIEILEDVEEDAEVEGEVVVLRG